MTLQDTQERAAQKQAQNGPQREEGTAKQTVLVINKL